MCNIKVIVISCVFFVHCVWARPNPGPAIDAIVFRDLSDTRNNDEEVITPPVLPVLDHLEHDPSTLVPRERTAVPKIGEKNLSSRSGDGGIKPRFGFSNAFDVSPNTDGGLTASLSNGYTGLGGHSQAASHSVSFGFNQGFQASQSASQSASFNNGFPGASFSGSQASSQSANFNSHGFSSSSAAASSAALAGASISTSSAQSQSAVNSFGQNGGSGSFGQSGSFGNSFGGGPSGGISGSGSSASAQSASVGVSGWTPNRPDAPNYGENNLDIRQQRRHRGRGDFVFPGESTSGRYQSSQFQVSNGGVRWRGPVEGPRQKGAVDWLTSVLLSD